MSISVRRLFAAGAGAFALVLGLTACGSGSGSPDSGGTAPSGKPVPGGVLGLLESEEPRDLDPGVLQNILLANAVVGNALYGTLMHDDPATGKTQYDLAESFTTTDGGKSFVLKLRAGLKFTDGTPLDASAVKYNWDRLADPKLASNSQQDASLIKSSKAVDGTTLDITLTQAAPAYGDQISMTGMNWIASPTALKKGSAAFDKNPVGAGPFKLKSWTHGGSIDLVKNADYYDAPKPYLDGLSIKSASGESQGLNSIVSGDVDLGPATSWVTVADAKAANLQVQTVDMSGGHYLAMNTTKAPFNDVRARQAVSYALDLDTLNDAVAQGKSVLANTLFADSSPLADDVRLHTYDHDKAQKLLNELAADGKPLSFTFTSFPGSESLAEAVQAQLQAFKGVRVTVRKVEWADSGKIYGTKDFQMLDTGSHFVDPEPQLWRSFYSASPRNSTGIKDAQLDAALKKGQSSTSVADRKAAYEAFAKRFAELVPGVFFERASMTTIASTKVGGITMYGLGSLLPANLWLQK